MSPLPPGQGAPARLVVLVSGTGSNLAALLDACADPGFGAQVVAVGADRAGIRALERAEKAGVPASDRIHAVIRDPTRPAQWSSSSEPPLPAP